MDDEIKIGDSVLIQAKDYRLSPYNGIVAEVVHIIPRSKDWIQYELEWTDESGENWEIADSTDVIKISAPHTGKEGEGE